jgi:hypothetical protein
VGALDPPRVLQEEELGECQGRSPGMIAWEGATVRTTRQGREAASKNGGS